MDSTDAANHKILQDIHAALLNIDISLRRANAIQEEKLKIKHPFAVLPTKEWAPFKSDEVKNNTDGYSYFGV